MRTYNPDRKVVKAATPQPSIAPPPREWKDGKLLHSLKSASEILNAYFDGGYSDRQMRRRMMSSEWTEGVHWFRCGGLIKVNLWAIVDWQIRTPR